MTSKARSPITAQVSSRPSTKLLGEHQIAVRPVGARQLLRRMRLVRP